MLSSLLAAFTGYSILAGNMSYWAIVVIFNLVTVIPSLGPLMLPAILGSDTPSAYSLGRIFELHFVIAAVILSAVFIHLTAVHRSDPSLMDDTYSSATLIDVISKDVLGIGTVLILAEYYEARSLLHPDY